MIFLDVDVRIVAHGFHQSALNLGSRVVGMVQDAELAVSSLAVKVELAVLLLVEIDTPLHQLLDLFRCFGDNLLHGFVVADVVASNHCILDVFVEVVHFEICD